MLLTSGLSYNPFTKYKTKLRAKRGCFFEAHMSHRDAIASRDPFPIPFFLFYLWIELGLLGI